MIENLKVDIAVLLRSRGWIIEQENLEGADLWKLEGKAEMYLPPIVRLGSFEWSDLTECISHAHAERIADVERQIELVRYDVTRFRMDDGPSWAHTVPLEAGATAVGSAFGMLRAAATAARRPRQMIGSGYSKLGDEIVRGARLAQTEQGSFVFPVALKVSAPLTEKHEPLEGVNYESARPESPERRVTRTLAQAMAAFDRHVLKPGKDPQSLALDQVVIAGGTKEMLAHLGRALSEPGISWFETGFTWAPLESVDKDVPSAVMISADTEVIELVTRSIKLLSAPKKNPLQVFTGPIISIRHEPEEPFGEIAIQTPLQGSSRLGRIEVRVQRQQLSDIHDWMDTAKTIVVHGVVERRPGKPARIEGIAQLHTLDEAMLFTQNGQS